MKKLTFYIYNSKWAWSWELLFFRIFVGQYQPPVYSGQYYCNIIVPVTLLKKTLRKCLSFYFILFKEGKRIRRWICFVFPPTNDVNESQKIDIKVITMLCHGQFLVHFLIETLFLGRDLYLCLWVLFWYIFYS